jgi:hypothetical protein
MPKPREAGCWATLKGMAAPCTEKAPPPIAKPSPSGMFCELVSTGAPLLAAPRMEKLPPIAPLPAVAKEYGGARANAPLEVPAGGWEETPLAALIDELLLGSRIAMLPGFHAE